MTTKKFIVKRSFSDLFIAMRITNDLTQEMFAKKLGWSRANVCDIEKGRKLVGVKRAMHFAKVFDLPLDHVLLLVAEDYIRKGGCEITFLLPEKQKNKAKKKIAV